MKYNYKKSSYLKQTILGILIVGLLLTVFYFFERDIRFLYKVSFGCIFLAVFFFVGSYGEIKNRYIELFDKSIRFNSFRFKDTTIKKPVSFNAKYEDIYGIGVKEIPLIGIWAIVVEAKYLPHGMTVSFCFENHKELCRNLCKFVREHNPNAYIDSRLAKYCEE